MEKSKRKKIRIKIPSFKLDITKYKTYIYVVYGFLVLGSIYHLVYAKRIIPGLSVGDVHVGGLTYSDALDKLVDSDNVEKKQVALLHDDKEIVITDEDIGLDYDWETTVSRAFEVGRTGNLYRDTREKLAGLIKGMRIGAFYDYDTEELNKKFALISGEINVSPVNADFLVGEDNLEITNAYSGIRIMDEAMYKMVMNAFDNMKFDTLTLPVESVPPEINESDLNSVFTVVKRVVFNELTVKYEDKEWVLDKLQLLDFLGYVKKKDGTLDLKLNEPKFESFLEAIAQEVNKLPRGKVTAVEGDKVLSFELTQEGTELDVKKFTEKFKDAYFAGGSSVDLVMNEIYGPARREDYGIFALLGEGSSKFTGSAQARINNLTLAAERTNGVLVPPGGVYSMNNSVGDISKKTGYDTAWIIKGDRTVLGEGGGVCQTSTTLFRAVLNSGLPVVMRYPHAYRVYYYEIDSPPGIDATIYQPSIDFQFKNDTPNYILVQSEANPQEKTLTFRIYGTPDNRVVDISEPVVTNQIPPPEPLYQDDPELPKGTVRQIDWAAWGATATFTRVVSRGDEVLFKEDYTTRYQPWRAVYLVGTKE